MPAFGFPGLIAAALASVPIPAAAPDAPKGQWIVSWDDQACSLVRLTEDEKPVSLALSMVPGTTYLRTTLLSPTLGRDQAGQAKSAALLFGDRIAGNEGQASAVHAERRYGFDFGLLDETTLHDFAKASSLSVRVKGSTLLQVPLPNAAKAAAELERCRDETLRTWGIDPAVRASLRRQPKPLLEIWRLVTDLDYPPAALSAGASGRAIVRLRISADGRVAGCAVAVSSGNKDLDIQTCAVFMQRARFEPALGADGKPVEAFFVSAMEWRIP